jgi:hypothetical protein
MATRIDAVDERGYTKNFYYLRIAAFVAVAACVLWALLGSWLTANEFTDAATEFSGYFRAPRSFDALALPGDWSGVHSGLGGHPIMVCGVKSRSWGLAIGSTNFSYGKWATCQRVEVGDEVWFFVETFD